MNERVKIVYKFIKIGLPHRLFILEMLKLISILICNEYFPTIKTIGVRYLQTMYNVKLKSSSQILGPGSRFVVMSLRLRSWFLDSGILFLGPRPNYECNFWVHSVIITKFDKKYYNVWQFLQVVTENYYKWWQVL